MAELEPPSSKKAKLHLKEVESVIPTSSRRSARNSDVELSVLPLKRRRSSIRRKSLVETLQSLSGKKPLLYESKPTIQDKEETLQPEITKNDISSLSDKKVTAVADTKGNFALEWHSTLQDEAGKWKSLLHQYQVQEEEARLKSASSLHETELSSNELSALRRPGSINYAELKQKVENMEQRFLVSLKSVSQCIDKIHDISLRQELWLHSVMEKEAQESLSQFADTDPKLIIENIFKLDKLREQNPTVT